MEKYLVGTLDVLLNTISFAQLVRT